MKNDQAMNAIKDLVDKRYHVWFNFEKGSKGFEGKKLNVGAPSQIFCQLPKKEISPQEDLKDNMKDLQNIREISVKKLEEATGNWAEENVLGRGGFGVVYKGDWFSTQIAIKKIEYRKSSKPGSGTFKDHWELTLNELRHLNNYRHDNILPIYGYAIKGDVCFFAFKYMAGGSLEDRLGKRSGFAPLTWPLRWNIAKGTAR